MTREKVLEILGGIFQESSTVEFDWSTVQDDTTIEELGFDSLTILDLLFDLEEALGLQIEAREMLNISTVGELLDHLEKRLAEAD